MRLRSVWWGRLVLSGAIARVVLAVRLCMHMRMHILWVCVWANRHELCGLRWLSRPLVGACLWVCAHSTTLVPQVRVLVPCEVHVCGKQTQCDVPMVVAASRQSAMPVHGAVVNVAAVVGQSEICLVRVMCSQVCASRRCSRHAVCQRSIIYKSCV
jgi:hypothetical protein